MAALIRRGKYGDLRYERNNNLLKNNLKKGLGLITTIQINRSKGETYGVHSLPSLPPACYIGGEPETFKKGSGSKKNIIIFKTYIIF